MIWGICLIFGYLALRVVTEGYQVHQLEISNPAIRPWEPMLFCLLLGIQIPGRMQKVDPPGGSMIYTI